MKTTRSRLLASGLGAMMLTMLFACAVTGVGVGVGYDGGYYEPYGYDYGGWGGTYFVGPGRCCGHRDERGFDRGRAGHAPAFRPAPAGRSAPSIPGRSRGR
jgi:hypothetical protein